MPLFFYLWGVLGLPRKSRCWACLSCHFWALFLMQMWFCWFCWDLFFFFYETGEAKHLFSDYAGMEKKKMETRWLWGFSCCWTPTVTCSCVQSLKQPCLLSADVFVCVCVLMPWGVHVSHKDHWLSIWIFSTWSFTVFFYSLSGMT